MSKELIVAIVDDDEVDLFIAQRIVRLKFNPSRISLYRSGFEFLDLYKDTGNTDVILLNYGMPEKSGLDVLNEMSILKAGEKPFVIITSTSLDPGDIARIKSHPKVDRFIPKPLLPAHLKKIMDELFASYQK